MSVSNGKVSATAPIGLAEIASLLNKPQDVASVCKADNINMWSIYRPIEVPGIVRELADSDRDVQKWGYRYGVATQTAMISPGYWMDTPPTTWCRLTDFAGYDHNAQKFLPTLQEQTVNLPSAAGGWFRLSLSDAFIPADVLNKIKLSMGVLNGQEYFLQNAHLGVRMNKEGSSTYYYATNQPLTEVGGSTPTTLYTDILIPRSLIPVQANETWHALLFASATKIESLQDAGKAGLFVVLDQRLTVPIKFIYSTGYTISIQLAQSSDKRTYSGSVVFRRTGTSGTYTFTDILLTLFSRPQAGYQVWAVNISDVTLNDSATTVTKNVSFTVGNAIDDPWLRLTANQGGRQINSGYQQALIRSEIT
ncbi:MAG: hypothetical protein J1E16_09680 [Muribaculaceae bacterium]|nr:hypothetical protein [Muribaculaceae bacterium]